MVLSAHCHTSPHLLTTSASRAGCWKVLPHWTPVPLRMGLPPRSHVPLRTGLPPRSHVPPRTGLPLCPLLLPPCRPRGLASPPGSQTPTDRGAASTWQHIHVFALLISSAECPSGFPRGYVLLQTIDKVEATVVCESSHAGLIVAVSR